MYLILLENGSDIWIQNKKFNTAEEALQYAMINASPKFRIVKEVEFVEKCSAQLGEFTKISENQDSNEDILVEALEHINKLWSDHALDNTDYNKGIFHGYHTCATIAGAALFKVGKL